MASATVGESLTIDVVGTRPPREAAAPTGSNPFALGDGKLDLPEKRASIISMRDPESGSATSAEDHERYPPPTDEERLTLRKVADSIPVVSFTLCIVELAERASYYAASSVFNNFIEYPLPEGGPGTGAVAKGDIENHAGALGRGLQFASAMVLLFKFLAYVFPILGAWIADTKIGRYKTIGVGVLICGFSHIIMTAGAAPSVLKAGTGTAPFLISFFLLAIGAGLFKPNVAPTVLDQYVHQREYTRVLKSGEKVLVDPETTIQSIMLIFYTMINVGAFFAIATTYAEKYVGFWLAYLIPTFLYLALPLLLLAIYKKTIKKPPKGSELTEFVKIIVTALKQNKFIPWGKNFWNNAKASKLAEKGITVSWSDKAVEDVHRTFIACQIFLYFPIYNLNDGGIGVTSSNQGAAMVSKGAPNDLLGNFNPLTIIVFIPFLSYVIYPTLRRFKITFGRISRITFGFLLAAISGVIGAIIQWRVYKTSPCGYQASDCQAGTSTISIWWQLPNVMLGAMSECFCNVTAYELSYARAPPNMKAIVMAMFLFTNALSSALAEILIPAIRDPYLIWVWAGPAIALFVQTAIFYWKYRHVDKDEFMTYEEEEHHEKLKAQEQNPEATPPATGIEEKKADAPSTHPETTGVDSKDFRA